MFNPKYPPPAIYTTPTAPPVADQTTVPTPVPAPYAPAPVPTAQSARPVVQLTPGSTLTLVVGGTAVVLVVGVVLVSMLLAVAITAMSVAVVAVVARAILNDSPQGPVIVMGLFSRKGTPPANPAMAELGREFANAKRHGDRKTVRRIAREYDRTAQNNSDAASFQHGQDTYNALPPAYPNRHNRRRS